MRVSIIVTTYNWPEALALVLAALKVQTFKDFEVIVADDGSTKDTLDLLDNLQKDFPVPLKHIWQEDKGFRAAMIRNKAISIARGDYIIFIDGDCVVKPDFIAKHVAFSNLGYFVSGNRVLLSKEFTKELLQFSPPIYKWGALNFVIARVLKKINRFLPILHLPLGILRKTFPNRWRGVKTCNLGVWKQDLLMVNGFEQQFIGWGYEDSDLVIRLLRAGVKCKDGRYGLVVLHLWHPENSRMGTDDNLRRLEHVLKSDKIRAAEGIGEKDAYI